MNLLRQTIRLILKESTSTAISYTTHEDLLQKIKPLVDQAWLKVQADSVRRHPDHAIVLQRTRFVPVYPGTPLPKGVLSDANQAGELVSKCDDLFAKTRLGTKCRADGNLANPPTHNALYIDIIKCLNINALPTSGTYNYSESSIMSLMSHELAHGIDRLSSVAGSDQIRDMASGVIDDLFNSEAVNDKQEFLSQLEDRMIRAGAPDHDIDGALAVGGPAWDHYKAWFSNKNERVALAIQLANALDQASISGNDFISSNVYQVRNEIPNDVLSQDLIYVMYGLLADDIDDEVEQIQSLTL